MNKQSLKLLACVAALWLTASACGGTQEASGTTADSPQEAESGADEEQADEVEASEPEPQDSAAPTTTEAAAPAEASFSSDEAIDMYDDWTDRLEEYVADNFVDGSSTYDQAVELLEVLDPALLDGAPADVAVDFHNCNANAAIEASAFFDISGADIDIEHLEQTPIDESTWALSYRSIVKFEGIPEQVSNETTLVTVDGVGPSLSLDDSDCQIPRSATADELVANAQSLLGIDPNTITEPVSSGDADGFNICEEVLASPPGAFTEGGCQFGGTGTLNLFGTFECDAGAAWIFDRDGTDGTWFGVEGGEWQELEAAEYTHDFIASQCS